MQNQGVQSVTLSSFATTEDPTGWSAEHELIRLAVALGPVTDDRRHQAAIVIRIEVHRTTCCPTDVQSMHPHIAGVHRIDEVAQSHATKRVGIDPNQTSHQARNLLSTLHSPGHRGLDPDQEFIGT